MADSKIDRVLNPCLLHLQKMELELKCPAWYLYFSCLKLFNNPMLLPCSHICCRSCIANPSDHRALCPACKMHLQDKELRYVPHVEALVTIFKSMSSSFSNLLQPDFIAAAFGAKWLLSEASNVCDDVTEANLPNVQASKISDDKNNTSPSGTRDVACVNEGEPCSPPSSGDTKYSDDDSNASGSNQKPPSKVSCKRKIPHDAVDTIESPLDSMAGKLHPENSCQNADNTCADRSKVHPERESKKCKMESEFISGSGEHGNDVQLKSDEDGLAGARSSNTGFDETLNPTCSILPSDAPSLLCVFCHSSTESEFTGPMLHYDDSGNSLDTSLALQPNVSHVHEKCINWAPQVYFDGDAAKNLEGEVSRAAKIKCSKCGQKGAALGCYTKSCRKSYHIPCALEVEGCRWDNDNFLMLCPTHFSKKFPSDRSKTQKKVKSADPSVPCEGSKPSADSTSEASGGDILITSLDATRGWIFCGSALSSSENNLLAKFAKMTGASLSRDWRPNVTHVIASTDELGACSRTLKYLMAILSGKWIVRIEWIKACMEAKCLVAEESYEINHDIHGCFDGPKNGRTRIMDKAPPIFSGLSFFFCGHFVPSYKGYLEDLISVAGGMLIKENKALKYASRSLVPTSFVVYNIDPPEECDLVDQANAIKTRLEEADAFASTSGSQVVAHTWVLDSIAACKLQPLIC